jgi:hypothetical protein
MALRGEGGNLPAIETTPSETKEEDMTATLTERPHTQDIERSRAVFSQQDFELIRKAIGRYIKDNPEDAEAVKYSSLYHRLGRIT